MPQSASPGIPWQDVAASAFRTFTVVHGREHLRYADLDARSKAGWEAVARQVRRCLLVKDAGPVPDESVWEDWHAEWEAAKASGVDPPSPYLPLPKRPGFIRAVAAHTLILAVLLAGVLFVSKTSPHPPKPDPAIRHDAHAAALAATREGRHREAVGLWSAALDCGGEPGLCLTERAYSQYATKDYSAALASLNLLDAHAGTIPRSQYLRGLVLLARGDKPEARELIRLAALGGDPYATRRLAEGVN